LLVLAVAAIGLVAVCRSPLGFAQPPAESRRSALIGGFAAATAAAAGAQPAWAGAKFSFFGFGSEGNKAMSDVYGTLDVDAYSPYSAFSGPSQGDNIYKAYNDQTMDKYRGYVRESSKRLSATIPKALAGLNKEEIKMENLRQVAILRDAAHYLADGYKVKGDGGAAEVLMKKFFENIEDLGVSSRLGKWKMANEAWGNLETNLGAFSSAVGA